MKFQALLVLESSNFVTLIFFQWHDPVDNNRQKKIIVALMKEVDELKLREKGLQSRISEIKMKEKCIWILLVVCLVCICFLLCLLCSRGV